MGVDQGPRLGPPPPPHAYAIALMKRVALWLLACIATLVMLVLVSLDRDVGPPELTTPMMGGVSSAIDSENLSPSAGRSERSPVSLRSPGRWTARVVDALSREGVASISSPSSGFDVYNLGEQGLLAIEGRADNDFVLVAPGYEPVHVALEGRDSDLGTIQMNRVSGTMTSVSVIDSEARPVPGAEVVVITSGGVTALAGITDSAGACVCSLQEGWRVLAQDKMLGRAGISRVAKVPSTMTILMSRASRVGVRTSEGRPMGGMPLLALEGKGESPIRMRTDDAGLVSVMLPTGTYVVHALGDPEGSVDMNREVRSPSDGQVVWLECAEPSGFYVEPRDAMNQEPLKHAFVQCYRANAVGFVKYGLGGIRASQDGRYWCLGPAHLQKVGSPDRVVIAARGFQTQTIERPTGEVLRVSMPRATSAKSKVVFRGRQWPMEGVEVRAVDGGVPVAFAAWLPTGGSLQAAAVGECVALVGDVSCGTLFLTELGSDVEVDVAAATGAVRLEVGADAPRLECMVSGRRFSPQALERSIVFPYLPPGMATIVVAGTNDTPEKVSWGTLDVRAGQTVDLDATALHRPQVCVGRAAVFPSSVRVHAVPSWSANGPVVVARDLRSEVDEEGYFRWSRLPATPPIVVFLDAADGCLLAASRFDQSGNIDLLLGDVEIRVSGCATSKSVRAQAIHRFEGRTILADGPSAERFGPGSLFLHRVATGVTELVVGDPNHGGRRASIVVVPGQTVVVEVDLDG